MKGQLSEGVLPGILRDLYVGRKTGMLRCTQGDERRNIRFRRGHIVNVDTNVQGKQLGEVIVEQGWIQAEDLTRATETVKATGRRLGEVLIEMGVLTSDKLEDALALHVQHIVARVFTWTEGQYEFEEEPDIPGEITLKLSTGELILEAVRQVGDPDVIRYALGDLDRVLALSSDPLLRFQKLVLSPTDGFVLSRVDGTLSAREVMQTIPLPVEETQKSLFGLLCTGLIEYSQGAPRKVRPQAASPARPVGSSAPPPRAAASPAPPAPAPAPSVGASPSPAVPATSPAMDNRRQEIADAYSGLKTRTFFEMLGIERSATEQQVKEAYFRLAKRFHPDAHHDSTLSDLVDQLEAVFIRLGEAYETLKSPRSRADYEERLGRQRPRGEGPAAPTGGMPAPAQAQDLEAERQEAEDAVRKAGWYFEKEKFFDAIQLLEPTLEKLEGKIQLRARVLLAKSYLKNPKWVKRAEETLLGVVHDDAQNVEAHFLLGTIYRDRGLKSRATTMFKKVLELKPDHEEALAAVGPLIPAEPEASGGGGLLGKFLRKR
jgi:Domain of unknown function (DUF4388)/DnaJ domain